MKLFAKYPYDEGLAFKIYKFLKFNSKIQTKKSNWKMGKRIGQTFQPSCMDGKHASLVSN